MQSRETRDDDNETTLSAGPEDGAFIRQPGTERLASLRRRMDHLEDKVEHLARLVRGNGDEGILGQLLLLNERVALLKGAVEVGRRSPRGTAGCDRRAGAGGGVRGTEE